MPQTIKKNKLISITYSILSEGASQVTSQVTSQITSQGNNIVEQNDIPIDFVYGVDDQIFPKIIMELEGKTIGDSVEVVLSPEEGFGLEDPELIITTSVESAPPEYRVIGAKPTFKNEQGETLEMTVTKIEDGQITVNGNHPFASKTLRFVVHVVGVCDSENPSGMDFSHDPASPTIQ